MKCGEMIIQANAVCLTEAMDDVANVREHMGSKPVRVQVTLARSMNENMIDV